MNFIGAEVMFMPRTGAEEMKVMRLHIFIRRRTIGPKMFHLMKNQNLNRTWKCGRVDELNECHYLQIKDTFT